GELGAGGAAAQLLDADHLRSHWVYPRTPADRVSLRVFEDLWSRGLYVGGGSAYGAEFVAYADLPGVTHSRASVLVTRGDREGLAPAQLSGFARVQQAVSKHAIIAIGPENAGGDFVEEGDAVVGEAGGKRAEEGVRYVSLSFHSVGGRGR
ncbi:unnamed protein product, partial [Discosporangium mesarthrocarpum]